MHVYKILRVEENEMFSYLNLRRDSEFSTFREALFGAFNIRKKKKGCETLALPSYRARAEHLLRLCARAERTPPSSDAPRIRVRSH
jgi:hypothetical protein